MANGQMYYDGAGGTRLADMSHGTSPWGHRTALKSSSSAIPTAPQVSEAFPAQQHGSLRTAPLAQVVLHANPGVTPCACGRGRNAWQFQRERPSDPGCG